MLAVEGGCMPDRPGLCAQRRRTTDGTTTGEDVLYSGTVAAAMEGLALGIPSMAFSFAGGDLRADVS